VAIWADHPNGLPPKSHKKWYFRGFRENYSPESSTVQMLKADTLKECND
jgi:hypothetical protein